MKKDPRMYLVQIVGLEIADENDREALHSGACG
jgi:hypothetical protein